MQLNELAPEFTLPDLAGRIHMLSDYRGKIVIVNFWSAECPHSERTDNSLLDLMEKWGQKVALLSIASNGNESEEMIAVAARRHKLPVVLRDANHQVADRYEASTTPHAFVLDHSGVLRYRGAVDNIGFRQRTATRFFIKEAVEALFDNHLPKTAEVLPFGCAIVRM